MHSSQILLALGLAIASAKAHNDERQHLPNANHIFNAIHSSMRQWGSSLNHNGMSLFIATVREGTQLYHGTSQPDRINGTQWLAFEPEHALVFARSRRGPPGPPGPGMDDGEEDEWHPPQRKPDDESFTPHHEPPKIDLRRRNHREDAPLSHTAAQRERARLPSEQQPLLHAQNQLEDESHGYLHTYLPKRDLRLLYIDGQSAAKSDKGTLDMQDIVLLQNTPVPDSESGRGPRHSKELRGKQTSSTAKKLGHNEMPKKSPHMGGPPGESFRAENLCAMASKEWNGRIDGFLRMELGFEVILCDFEKDLDVHHITSVKQSPEGDHHDENSFSYYQAVASRFDGIGGGRVRLNYENFVTLFADERAVFFDEEGLPRARNESEALKSILEQITEMVLYDDHDQEEENVDWQAISDMVIARYADRIEFLASGDLHNHASFNAEIDAALRPFIDYSARNTSLEIKRCATQYLSNLPQKTDVAAHAILNVTARLCASLSAAGEKNTLREGLAIVRGLKEWLAWTTWKRCRGCGYSEVCFVPIWPMGSKEERDRPRCVGSMSETKRGYWGGMGGGPPPAPHGRSFA